MCNLGAKVGPWSTEGKVVNVRIVERARIRVHTNLCAKGEENKIEFGNEFEVNGQRGRGAEDRLGRGVNAMPSRIYVPSRWWSAG